MEVRGRPDIVKFVSNNEAIRWGCNSIFLGKAKAKRANLIYPDGRSITVVISRSLEGCLELTKEMPLGQKARHPDMRMWEEKAKVVDGDNWDEGDEE